MTRIGLLSDTHGFLHPGLESFFLDCDEIWHAGDIGDFQLVEGLEKIKHLRAVYGNIDDNNIRKSFSEYLVFKCEEVKVLMTHIGGYPGNYNRQALEMIRKEQPGLFITGHSHILKVMFDHKNNLLYMNPGAAGNKGWHKVITYARFAIDGKIIKDLEIKEIQRKQ